MKSELESIDEDEKGASAELESIYEKAFLDREKLQEYESDVFIKYSYRSEGLVARSSWDVLAEMRHSGVPTRLLDWTESLSVALYFAVRPYYEKLTRYWQRNPKNEVIWKVPQLQHEPCVWVMNPYILSMCATNGLRSSIWDFSFDDRRDYYEGFLREEKITWKYTFPIPIYPPWKNLRIAAQQGVFTVHGTLNTPVEQLTVPNHIRRAKSQRGETIERTADLVRKVTFSPEVAAYVVRHLRRYENLNEYTLFRDSDSLGAMIKEEMNAQKINLVEKLLFEDKAKSQ